MDAVIQFIVDHAGQAAIEAVFTAFFTALMILIPFYLSGRRLTNVTLGAFNLRFAAKETQSAYDHWKLSAPSNARIKRLLRSLAGNWRILWVDDHPEGNRFEMEALSAVGFNIMTARNNEEAVQVLRENHVHFVISDIGRDNGPSGLDLPDQARAAVSRDLPFVFYVGERTGARTPGGDPVADSPARLYEAIKNILSD